MDISTTLDNAPWLTSELRDDALAEQVLPDEVARLLAEAQQSAIPLIAKQPRLMEPLERLARRRPSSHSLLLGDARRLEGLPANSVHLVVTSPPYWNLKQYEGSEGQLGDVESYEEFLGSALFLREMLRHAL